MCNESTIYDRSFIIVEFTNPKELERKSILRKQNKKNKKPTFHKVGFYN